MTSRRPTEPVRGPRVARGAPRGSREAALLLAGAGVYLALVHALRVALLWQQRAFWRAQPWSSPWWLQLGASACWMTVFLFLAWGWLTSRAWARRGTGIAVIVYAAWYWFDRLVLADPSLLQAGTAFALGTTLVLGMATLALARYAGTSAS